MVVAFVAAAAAVVSALALFCRWARAYASTLLACVNGGLALTLVGVNYGLFSLHLPQPRTKP